METPQASRNLSSRVRQHPLAATFALLAALSFGILAGSILTRTVGAKAQAVDSSDARPLTIPSPVILSNEFARISKEVGPAVVNINTITLPRQSSNRRSAHGAQRVQPNGDPGNGDEGDLNGMLKRYFGGQDGQDPDDGDPSGSEHEALGSGFIVDSRGYIITNNHVVDKADHIFVKLSTDPEGGSDHGRPAHVVGTDPDTDIAVIKIDAPREPLPTVKLGNSDGAQVGDWVLAIGSPFSLSETVTAGIVSAKNRSIEDNNSPSQFQRFIQTDAAINPGNSGGPLVDMAGQVIGMNTAIYTQSMGSQGVGFAMPSNVIANIYNMLISPEHKVIRGSIGIKFQDIPADSPVGREYGFASGGVLVSMVTPNAPASKAGIRFGDAIVAVDGKLIKGGDDLVADISARKVGSTVQLSLVRNGEKMNLTVGIADRSKLSEELADKTDEGSAPPQADAGDTKLGIKVDAIPSQVASKIGVKGGVIVVSVRPGSFANMITLAKDDVITAINRRPVTDQSSYNAIVSTLKSGDDVVFEVHSAHSPATAGPSFVYGTLP
ncbi:MAG TPA: trypsin-like peptidase domain-containing protein [Acidobacteriaceae bacterium]|nr:trypsin-like peptidase domain-containing protein [Acidobacteriaceae bacterium]